MNGQETGLGGRNAVELLVDGEHGGGIERMRCVAAITRRMQDLETKRPVEIDGRIDKDHLFITMHIHGMLDLQLEIREGIEAVKIAVPGTHCLESFKKERAYGIVTTRRIPVADDEHRVIAHQSAWQIAPSM